MTTIRKSPKKWIDFTETPIYLEPMQSIGERLEEARKRQGLSIRDAAEATKIRADFLVDFENNRFDQNLPDLYKRGFIKVYAKFLKIDGDKLAKDFNATYLGITTEDGSDSSLGRVEVDNKYSSHYTTGEDAGEAEGPGGIDAAVYWKIAISLGLLIALLGLVVFGISMMDTDADTDERPYTSSTPDSTTTGNIDTSPEAGTAPSSTGPRIITLIATGDTSVRVRDAGTWDTLFSGPMIAGQRETFEIVGQIEVSSTDMENIQIHEDDGTPDGKTMWFETTGLGKYIY